MAKDTEKDEAAALRITIEKSNAIHEYAEAYKHYSAVSITQEEAAIRMNEASRAALNLGVPLQTLRETRQAFDNHAEFMTDWK